MELTVKTIVMRGRRFNDMRGWDLDPQTRNDLRAKPACRAESDERMLYED